MSICKGCGAEISWIRTKNGKSMPVDEKPVPYYEGSSAKIVLEDGTVVSGDLDGPEEMARQSPEHIAGQDHQHTRKRHHLGNDTREQRQPELDDRNQPAGEQHRADYPADLGVHCATKRDKKTRNN